MRSVKLRATFAWNFVVMMGTRRLGNHPEFSAYFYQNSSMRLSLIDGATLGLFFGSFKLRVGEKGAFLCANKFHLATGLCVSGVCSFHS
jgi:hypothetical protein